MTVPHAAPSLPVAQGSLRVLVRPLLLLAAFVALTVVLGRLPGVRGMLAAGGGLHAGAGSAAVFVLVASAFCGLGLPRQAVCFAAGAAYGIGAGCALATMATVAGCLWGYGWGRWAGRMRMPARLGATLARVEGCVRVAPFASVLALRLMPVGSALLLNLAAGMLGVRVVPFVLATVLGSLPQTVVFVLVGTGMQLGGSARIGVAIGLFGLSAGVGVWLMRRMRGVLPWQE
ncbi:VTT domain-containing protein [Komagataeibacter sp. AV436]|uniref:TVP38/TMEM64 family membrane protein n=1 Tax=Komagataeibacter melomenusus TaxID=2766578 RepID=A0ABX2AIS6_9PROT|nr:VTT domain-containing protein [Komagataeibacter melomenusus]MBV1831805.1 VTT domain-containing protein [Komagataeibacter melomenusus]NPC67902.1 VTT domain-containing protein [Komagataeibacter melomenusus]